VATGNVVRPAIVDVSDRRRAVRFGTIAGLAYPIGMARPHRILCVEDDPTALKVIQTFLLRQGYEVQTATDGQEALASVDRSRPDIILLDVMMPGMTGYEVSAKLREHPDHAYIPVIFLTALAEAEERERAFAAGAVDFLNKPVQRARLLQKVAAHLETSDDWAQLRNAATKERKPKASFAGFLEYLAGRRELSPEDADVLATSSPDTVFLDAAAAGFDPDDVSRHMADFLDVPFVERLEPERLALGVLPTLVCAQREVLPLERASGELDFVVGNPFDPQIETLLDRCVGEGARARISVATSDDLFAMLSAQEEPIRRDTAPAVDAGEERIERLVSWILEGARSRKRSSGSAGT